MKTFANIVFIPDLLRNARGFPEGFFDILREPVLQGTGIKVEEISWAAENFKKNSGFNFSKFLEFAGIEKNKALEEFWASNYYTLQSSAIDYLLNSLPQTEETILLIFESPPWLEQACLQRGIDFIDLRISPLRFGRDLYVALRTSNLEIFQRIRAHTVTQEEIRLEASLLGANLRMHQAHQTVKNNYRADSLDNSIVFVGQTPNDASLLSADNHFLRCSEFSDSLIARSKEKRFFYKIHPLAGDFFRDEISALRRIIGHTPQICHKNAYQILSSKEDVELIGISSGMLQEAAWFKKTAHMLFQPYVPLFEFAEAPNLKKYQQIHFQTFLSPAFWHQSLAPEKPAPRLAALPALTHHHARETMDHWWDYSKVMTWERSLPVESFERAGGGLLRQRIETLERSLVHLSTAQVGNNPETPQVAGITPDTQRWQNMDARHLKELTDPQEAAALFKHSVRMVEIEVPSYCNRKCWFCPNATYDRVSDNKLMPAEMYSSILRQLASIGYDGAITYSRYNEPLADKMILERIAEARRMLPDAQLHTNTNGDYLDLEYIEQLYAVGLRSLNIQIYLANKEHYDHAKIKAAGDKILKRVKLPHTLTRDTPGEWYEHALHYRDMSIRLYGRNFEIGGTSRGGEVPIHMDYQRTSPCLIPFWAVYIDHDGSTVPCCNLRSDIPSHAGYVIGKLAQQPDLFLQYASRFAANFRTSLIKEGVKKGVCSNCHYAEEGPSQQQTIQLADLLATRER